MEDLGAVAQRFTEAWCTHREDHEFLQIDTVVGVLTTIDDIHHRDRHLVSAITEVDIE